MIGADFFKLLTTRGRVAFLVAFLYLTFGVEAENFFEIVSVSDDGKLIRKIARDLTPEKINSDLFAFGDVNISGPYVQTALMWVAGFNENPAVLRVLLDNNANRSTSSSLPLANLILSYLILSSKPVLQ